MPYDRKHFFDTVRKDLFRGTLTQRQVDGMEYLLAVWERHFEKANPRDGTKWLAYCLATAYHETAQTMEPIEEYGKGSGKSYGKPAGPHGQRYYGRGFVQITWSENYEKAQRFMKERYNIDAPIHKEAHRALEHEIAALILFDGSVWGWFTSKKLGDYFNGTTEDPVNARRIINGTDKADLIAGYYRRFLASLKKVAKVETPDEVEAELPGLPAEPPMPEPGTVDEEGNIHREARRARQDERYEARHERREDRKE
jgi:putative chitinase